MKHRLAHLQTERNVALSRAWRALAGIGALALCVVGSAAPVDSYSSPYEDAVLADNPAGFWRLGEAAGSAIAEDSSHEIDGVYRANVTPGAPGAIESDEDTAASFTAQYDAPNADQVDVPVAETANLAPPFTAEAWIRTDTAGGTVIGGDDGWGDTPPGWAVFVRPDGRLGATYFAGKFIFDATGPAVTLTDGQWHHVVVVFASTRTLYVDGVRSTEPEQRRPYVPPQAPPGEPEEAGGVTIGDVVGGTPFSGQIDDVALYTYALSEARMEAHRSAAWPGAAGDDVTLTAAERDRAIAIATTDSRVVELLGGRPVTAEPVNVWTTTSGTGKLGAQVTLAWAGPVSLSYAWPFLLYDETEASSPPYTESTAYSAAQGVTELDVTVDLTRGAVVQIQPDGEDINESASSFSLRSAATVEQLVPGMTGDKAGTTKRLRRITDRLVPGVGVDWFWNFDFDLGLGNGEDCIENQSHIKCRPRPGRVDWPINMIFINSADTYKAKVWGGGGGWLPDDGSITSKMWARVYDNPGAVGSDPRGYPPRPTPTWDSDQGSSLGGVGCYANKWHLRVYAPSEAAGGDERMFNLNWGFYVIGSTHRDYHELCQNGSAYSGDSELAERKLRKSIVGETDWLVEPDKINLRNKVDAKAHRKHWDSNGMATVVHVR